MLFHRGCRLSLDPAPGGASMRVRSVIDRLYEQRRREGEIALQTQAALARRRPIVVAWMVLGGIVLAFALRVPPGQPAFYWASAALGAVWLGGWLTSGRTWRGTPTDLPIGFACGAILLVIFLLGASVVAQIEVLPAPVDALLAHARWGALPLVALITAANGVTEELFFRGAVYDAFYGKHPVIVSTIAYTLVTALSGIVLLAFAGALLGLLCAWLRRISSGVIAPITAHVTWSLGMLFWLGPVLDLWR